jgi:hypothetical protein
VVVIQRCFLKPATTTATLLQFKSPPIVCQRVTLHPALLVCRFRFLKGEGIKHGMDAIAGRYNVYFIVSRISRGSGVQRHKTPCSGIV